MELYLLSFLLIYFCFFNYYGLCKSDIPLGYRVTLPIPTIYNIGFIGRAFLMDTSKIIVPNFKVALSVEALNSRYSCSLQVFLGDFKVWNSGHFTQFYPSKRCVLVLTKTGDLQLKGSRRRIGWQTGTSGQGVEKLQLIKTGNLILTDTMNNIKWQSFDFPTNVMLWGQRLNVPARLTSFTTNSTMFYSFEIQNNKLALYLNSDNSKYSYWEFRPPKSRNITSAELGSTGLKLFDRNHRKLAQISSRRGEPLRFLALGDSTGNLGLYHYSPYKGKFEVSFQALNTTCDLPLTCGPYGVCTFSNSCTCVQFSSHHAYHMDPNCNEEFSDGFCGGHNAVEMVEIEGVSSTLKGSPQSVNVSKDECVRLCMDDCKCVAALYSVTGGDGIWHECFHYGFVRGVKQVKKGIDEYSYLVKVPKGMGGNNGKSSNVRKWLLIMGGVVDGLIIFVVVGGFGYYFFVIRKRRNDLIGNESNHNS